VRVPGILNFNREKSIIFIDKTGIYKGKNVRYLLCRKGIESGGLRKHDLTDSGIMILLFSADLCGRKESEAFLNRKEKDDLRSHLTTVIRYRK
jgi:hypothetical protein